MKPTKMQALESALKASEDALAELKLSIACFPDVVRLLRNLVCTYYTVAKKGGGLYDKQHWDEALEFVRRFQVEEFRKIQDAIVRQSGVNIG